MIPHISLSRAYCATLIALIHPIALPMTCFFPMTLFFLSRFSWHIYHPNLFLGLRRRGGNRRRCCGFAVGAGVGLAALPEGLLLEVWELLGFAVTAGFGVAVALALPAVLLSVLLSGFGVAVGLTVAAAPAEGVAVGFADALGLALLAAVELVFETGLLLTALVAELSTPVSAVLLPAHAAMVSINAAVIKIAVIFFFM